MQNSEKSSVENIDVKQAQIFDRYGFKLENNFKISGEGTRTELNQDVIKEYRIMLLQLPSTHEEQIVKDLHRTFPEQRDFMDGELICTKLFQTLKAYAVYDPELGYCQGIGFIAAVLNMYYTAEESFYMLVLILDEREDNVGGFNDRVPHSILSVEQLDIDDISPVSGVGIHTGGYGLRRLFIHNFPLLQES
ncbi:MAG: hypothetical protein EZS28_045964, partial [Streblomastix strix]